MSPCKRRDFVKKLKNLGFEGPYIGSKHEFMTFEYRRLTIPSNDEYSVPQLKMMLKEIQNLLNIQISNEFWSNL